MTTERLLGHKATITEPNPGWPPFVSHVPLDETFRMPEHGTVERVWAIYEDPDGARYSITEYDIEGLDTGTVRRRGHGCVLAATVQAVTS